MGRFADLAGKTAIVTGGALGIGEAISRGLAENGVDVAVVTRASEEAATRVAADLAALGTRSFALMTDVSREDEVDRMLRTVVDRLGKVDILVNCAGGGPATRPVAETPLEQWNEILTNNLTSCFLCSRAVLPGMIERKWGRIINIASVAGLMPISPSHPAYSTSKAGMIGFTKHLAMEVVKQGITVNATAPGTTWSPRAERRFASTPGYQRVKEAAIPLGRLATAEEQAGIVTFLASDEARYITGVTVEVAGGAVMM